MFSLHWDFQRIDLGWLRIQQAFLYLIFISYVVKVKTMQINFGEKNVSLLLNCTRILHVLRLFYQDSPCIEAFGDGRDDCLIKYD